MSRNSTLILLGILVVFVPFSGLPIAIRNFLAVILGACIASIGLSMRARAARDAHHPPTTPVESSFPASIPPPIISPI